MTDENEQNIQPIPQEVKRKRKKKKLPEEPRKRGIRFGLGSIVLVVFCSFLLVIATFLQLNITHFILPSKFFTDEVLHITDFLHTYRYIPQIPAVMFIIGLLGRRLGITSIAIYIVVGLFFIPVFALGGGWQYIFEFGFGYIFAYILAGIITGGILKKDYSYINVAKAVILGVLTIHFFGILYMILLAILKHMGAEFVFDWIYSQSGVKIIYDLIFSYLAVLVAKYARIILWLYLY